MTDTKHRFGNLNKDKELPYTKTNYAQNIFIPLWFYLFTDLYAYKYQHKILDNFDLLDFFLIISF